MEQRGNVNSDYCYQRSGSSMVANSPHESSVQVISVIEYHIETIYIYTYIFIYIQSYQYTYYCPTLQRKQMGSYLAMGISIA